ncbi:peptide ligase PGM1-related protein [Streptomyces sp. MMS24-I2-30]|uniref:preATP grasp domain-containing protein n=1 Tax=Streptomyces sp. MMS24-I2-30 TaxID=3351564 RepID=UPI003896E64E
MQKASVEMATLIVSNQRTEEMVGDLELLDPEYRLYVGNQAQRMAWCLREGDVLVLPVPVHEEYLRYVTATLGIPRDSVRVLVPPTGRLGEGVLSQDRLTDGGFIEALRAAVQAHGVDDVLPFHFDSSLAELTRTLGLDKVTPGFGFLDQGGGRLLNSKSTFRALAGGTGAPVPPGGVFSAQKEAEAFLWERLLSQGQPAILKQDFHVAGFGNEIVSPYVGIDPLGAQRAVVAGSRADLGGYLTERWPWLTDGGRNQVVIEQYLPESAPIYAEVRIEEHGVEFTGHGEMRMKPVLNGLIVPAPSAELPAFPGFLEAVRRLCRPIHAMGYRGIVSIDAIVTPDRNILINEFNCRTGGSTHIHRIGERVVGDDYFEQRVLVELRRCTFPPFATTVQALADHGLAYDPESRTGVLITVDDNSASGGFGEYCVVARDAAHARELEQAVAELLAPLSTKS